MTRDIGIISALDFIAKSATPGLAGKNSFLAALVPSGNIPKTLSCFIWLSMALTVDILGFALSIGITSILFKRFLSTGTSNSSFFATGIILLFLTAAIIKIGSIQLLWLHTIIYLPSSGILSAPTTSNLNNIATKNLNREHTKLYNLILYLPVLIYYTDNTVHNLLYRHISRVYLNCIISLY